MKMILAILMMCFSLNGFAGSELLTVEGPIAKIVSQKKEIYVQGPERKLEFYFKADTKLMQGQTPVDFSTLKKDQKVRVTYKVIGKRTEPTLVEIIE